MKRKAIFTAVFFVLFFNSIYLTDLVNRYTISSNKQYYFIVIYFLLLQVVIGVPLWRKFNKARIDKRQIMKWILTASILSILIVVAGGEVFNNHKYQDSSLEITATGDKNQSSQSSEVWITGININSSFIDLDKFKSNFWEFREGNLLSYSNQPSTITIELPSAKDIKISFLKHQWSGIIKINDGGVQTAVDLYSPEGGSYEYIVKGNISSSTNKFVFDYMMATIFCFSLIFIILFIASTNHIWFGVFLSGIYILIFILTRKLEIDRISDILLICATFICGFIFAKITKRQWLKSYFDKKIKISVFLIISLFSAFAISGNSLFFENGVFSFTIQNFCIFLLVFLWMIPFAILFLCGVGQLRLRKSDIPMSGNYFKLWIIFFAIQVTFGLIYFIAYYPANMSPDSIDQWMQARGIVQINDWHPAIYTLIIKVIIQFIDSPSIIALLQLSFFSAVISSCLLLLCRHGLKVKWALAFAAIFILIPSNGINIVTLWKDIPYTISLLWLTLLFAKMILNGDKFPNVFNLISLALALVSVYLFRHNGVVPYFLSLLTLLIFGIRYRQYKILISIFISIILIYTVKVPIYSNNEVIPNVQGVKYVAPIHGIASVVYHDGSISNKTNNFLEGIMSKQEWINYYDQYTSNPYIYDYPGDFVGKLSSSHTVDIISMYINTLIRNPGIVIYDRFSGMNLLWDVFEPSDSYNKRFSNIVVENTLGINRNENVLTIIFDNFLDYSQKVDLLDSLLWRGGIYLILFFLVLFYTVISKEWKILYLFVPYIGGVFSLTLSMAVQSYRYIYFEFFIIWFLIAAIIFFNKNRDSIKYEKGFKN